MAYGNSWNSRKICKFKRKKKIPSNSLMELEIRELACAESTTEPGLSPVTVF